MPCGGIYRLEAAEGVLNESWARIFPCRQCRKSSPPCDRLVMEWDDYLHATCIDAFLATDEGQIILDHKHLVER